MLAVAALACVPAPVPAAHGQSDRLPRPTGNGTYIAIDPLAGVRYDNRYDVSLGMAYDHMKAGPNLLQGSNLGGLDLSGSYWLQQALGAWKARAAATWAPAARRPTPTASTGRL